MENKFDASKQYKWNADQEVVITGLDFSMIYNTLQAEMEKPENQEIIRKYEQYQRMQAILVREVKEGRFVEQTTEN